MFTEAEQNRFITDNMDLAIRIAATFRHRVIPQDELEAEARLGLTEAGREWRGGGKFTTFAIARINSRLINFIAKWEELRSAPTREDKSDQAAEDKIERFWHEWSRYFVVPYETWTSLAATPEDLVVANEQMRDGLRAMSGAMIGLNKRQREMMTARFIDRPNKTLRHIAQDHRVSYSVTVRTIRRALIKLARVFNALRTKDEQIELTFSDGRIKQKKPTPMMTATESGRQKYNKMWERIEGGRAVRGLSY